MGICVRLALVARLFFGFSFDQAFGDWRTWFVVCLCLRLWWLLYFLFLLVVVFLVLAAASLLRARCLCYMCTAFAM